VAGLEFEVGFCEEEDVSGLVVFVFAAEEWCCSAVE
jgi:hypothetical protein